MDHQEHSCDSRVYNPPRQLSATIKPVEHAISFHLDGQKHEVEQTREYSEYLWTQQNDNKLSEDVMRSENNIYNLFIGALDKPSKRRLASQIPDDQTFCHWVDGVFSDDESIDGDAMDVDTEQNTTNATEKAYIPWQKEVWEAFSVCPGHGPGYGRLNDLQREEVDVEAARLQSEDVDMEAAPKGPVDQNAAVLRAVQQPQANHDISLLYDLELSSRDTRVSRKLVMLKCPGLLQNIGEINHRSQKINERTEILHQQRLYLQLVNLDRQNRATSRKASSNSSKKQDLRPVKLVRAGSFVVRHKGEIRVVGRRFNDIDPMLAAPIATTPVNAPSKRVDDDKNQTPTMADFVSLAGRIEKNAEHDQIFCLHEQWRNVLRYIERLQPYIFGFDYPDNDTLVAFSANSRTLELRFLRVDKDDIHRYMVLQNVQAECRLQEESRVQNANKVPRIIESHSYDTYRRDICFPELAITKISPAKENRHIEHQMFKDGLFPEDADFEDCTFCLFDCDYGVYDERFWLDMDSSQGYCTDCYNSTSIFNEQWILMLKTRIEHNSQKADGASEEMTHEEKDMLISRTEAMRYINLTDGIRTPLRDFQAQEDAAKQTRIKQTLSTPAGSREERAMDYNCMNLISTTILGTVPSNRVAEENPVQVGENFHVQDQGSGGQQMQFSHSQQSEKLNVLRLYEQHDLYHDYPNSPPVVVSSRPGEELRRQAIINGVKAAWVQQQNSPSAGGAKGFRLNQTLANTRNLPENTNISPVIINSNPEGHLRRRVSINGVKAAWVQQQTIPPAESAEGTRPNQKTVDRRISSPFRAVEKLSNVQDSGSSKGSMHLRGGAGKVTSNEESSDDKGVNNQPKTATPQNVAKSPSAATTSQIRKTVPKGPKSSESMTPVPSTRTQPASCKVNGNRPRPAPTIKHEIYTEGKHKERGGSNMGVLGRKDATPRQASRKQPPGEKVERTDKQNTPQRNIIASTPTPSRKRAESSETKKVTNTPGAKVKTPCDSSTAKASRQRASSSAATKPAPAPALKSKTVSKSSTAALKPSRQRASSSATAKLTATPASNVKATSNASASTSILKRRLSSAQSSNESPSKRVKSEAPERLRSLEKEVAVDPEFIIPAPPVSEGFTRQQLGNCITDGSEVAQARKTPEPRSAGDIQDVFDMSLTPQRRKKHDDATKNYRQYFGDRYERQQEKFKAQGRQVVAPIWNEEDFGIQNGNQKPMTPAQRIFPDMYSVDRTHDSENPLLVQDMLKKLNPSPLTNQHPPGSGEILPPSLGRRQSIGQPSRVLIAPLGGNSPTSQPQSFLPSKLPASSKSSASATPRRGSFKDDGCPGTSPKSVPQASADNCLGNGLKFSAALNPPRDGDAKSVDKYMLVQNENVAQQSQAGDVKASASNAQSGLLSSENSNLPKARSMYELQYSGPERGIISDQDSIKELRSISLDIQTVLDSPIACVSPYSDLHVRVLETGVTMADIECAIPLSWGTWRIAQEDGPPTGKPQGKLTSQEVSMNHRQEFDRSATQSSRNMASPSANNGGQGRRALVKPQMVTWPLPNFGTTPLARRDVGPKRPDFPPAGIPKNGQRTPPGSLVQCGSNHKHRGLRLHDPHNPKHPSSLRKVQVVPPSPALPTHRSPHQEFMGHIPRGTQVSLPAQSYSQPSHNHRASNPRISVDRLKSFCGILFCRGCPWRQVDITKARICGKCKDTKLAIIMHRHYEFIPLDELGNKQNGYFTGDNLKTNIIGKKLRACMICPSRALWVCKDCPLRACEGCKTNLVNLCKGKVENLLMSFKRQHVRNDAFLLRADGGGF